MALKHAKTSGVADSGDASLVQPSDWNEDHVVDTGGVIFSGSHTPGVGDSPGEFASLRHLRIAGRPTMDFSSPSSIAVGHGLVQHALWRNRLYFCQAMGAGSTSFDTTGYASPVVNAATATGRPLAGTNYYTRQRRIGMVSSASAGVTPSLRTSSTALVTLGNGTDLGGFFTVLRFGCSDAATVAGARMFAGATASVSNANNVEPSTLTNCIGVGHGAADTNMKLFYGGSSAQTPIDLGADFPANTLSTDAYELILYSPPDAVSTVYWQVTRLNTGHAASGSVSGAGGVILPSSSTFLSPWYIWRTNNTTALAVAFDFMFAYFDTDGF